MKVLIPSVALLVPSIMCTKKHFAVPLLFCLVGVLTSSVVKGSDKSLLSSGSYNFPGGIAQLVLPKVSSNLPIVKFGLEEPPIIESDDSWKILIGLDLKMLPGEYLVYVKHDDPDALASNVKFDVIQKSYPILEAVQEGSSDTSEGISHKKFSEIDFENSEQPRLPLAKPVDGQWLDRFGSITESDTKIRTLNYVSIESAKLSIITAPQNAIVSRIIHGAAPDSPAIVFLDHGRGVYSILDGVSDLSVEVGNGIVSGAVIGKLPASSNPDDPSILFWQCIVNGVYVNPLILTELNQLES